MTKNMTQENSIKNIRDYSRLFDVMKKNGFFSNPHEQVETFIQGITFGENTYSNMVLEVKIMRNPYGQDMLFNNHGTIHPVIAEMFAVA